MKLKKFKYFYPERPKLISKDQSLFSQLSKSDDWVAEKKFNETRLMLHVVHGDVQFWNRHGQRMSYKPTKEILERFKSFRNESYVLFDGGLRHNRVTGVKNKIVIWDVFIWKSELLTNKPFWYRRNILEKIICPDETVTMPFQYKNDFGKVFSRVIKSDEIEGLVMKNLKGMLKLSTKNNMDSSWMYKVRKPSGRYKF